MKKDREEKQKGTEELKAAHRKELLEKFSGLRLTEAKAVMKIVQFDTIKMLINNLKNMKNTTPEVWKNLLTRLMVVSKIKLPLGKNEFDIYSILETLLALVAAFVGANLAFKCNEKSASEAAVPIQRDDNVVNNDAVSKMLESYVMECAKDERNKFSLTKTKETKQEDSSDGLCECNPECVVCEVKETSIPEPSGTPTDVLVEYDREKPHTYKVSEGQSINADNILGDINGVPVKSKISGTVTEVNEKYFICSKDSSININPNDLMKMYDNKSMDDVNEICKKDSDATNFIVNCLSYTRIPSIALHTREHNKGNDAEISSEEYIEKYIEKSTEIKNTTKDEITEATKPDNVKQKMESGQFTALKDEITNIKKKCTNKFINLYKGYNEIGYCSKGRISDFMLLDSYVNYMTGDDFVYDDDNPYVVKLHELISSYIGSRLIKECGSDNTTSLRTKLDELCDANISQYMPANYGSYYDFLKSRFPYTYYADGEDEIKKAAPNDKDRVTLYSKLFDFLKNLTGYTRPVSKSVEYTEGMDTDAVLNSGNSEQVDMTLETNLKKIALTFSMMVFAENRINEEKKTVLKPFDKTGATSEYYIGYSGDNKEIKSAKKELNNYIQTLMDMTESEERELTKLSDEVIEWYRHNDDDVMSGKIFERFKEAEWSEPTTIYRDNIPYEYRYVTVTESAKIPKQRSVENITDDDPPSSYVNSDAGPNDLTYWLVYMGWATLVNCMMPMYWSTGLVILGVPILFPTILIPFCVVKGRVTIVIGMGLCGICPMPMILFVNMGNIPGITIPPINTIIDIAKMAVNVMMTMAAKTLTLTTEPLIKAMDEKISLTERNIADTEEKIKQLEAITQSNRGAFLRKIKRIAGKESTSKKD